MNKKSLESVSYKFGFHKREEYAYVSPKGLSEKTVRKISDQKNEPEWMLERRLTAYHLFRTLPYPSWGGNLSPLDLQNIRYYIRPTDKKALRWEDLPEDIRDTYDRIGIPEAERKYLGGVSAQYESEVVYKSIKKSLSEKGVIFLDMDSALMDYPDLVREYFSTVIPPDDNKFAALNTAVWSGGSFIYIPKGVRVELPLQAYFRINAASIGQFERTLIIADEASYVHYIEGCTAPVYTTDSLHAAVVEIIVKKGARVRYTTIQNWSKNVYNLVTKRMKVGEDGIGEWVDGNLGSRLTMKYPALVLAGKGAHGELLSMAYAGDSQHQDAGGKVIHLAPGTSSRIISKSISADGGRASYRGRVYVSPEACSSKTKVNCDALILDSSSRSDTYPDMDIRNDSSVTEHEATVSKIGEEQMYYLQSRGLSKTDAESLIVNGFIEPIVKELPLEYAVELNRLIQLQMDGSVG